MSSRHWLDLISMWEGLVKVRQLLSSIEMTGLLKIDQAYLDRAFPEHKFIMTMSHKDQLLQALANQDSEQVQMDEHLKLELDEAKKWLSEMGDEITLYKETDNYHYSFVLKDENDRQHLTGFVRIDSKINPYHKALLSWNDTANPVMFLAELKDSMMYFHVNYGNEGLAIIQEADESYKWTHSLKSEYLDLIISQHGSVVLDKGADNCRLADGNLAAAKALSHAKTIGENGKTLFENNIILMNLYKKDLNNLFEIE